MSMCLFAVVLRSGLGVALHLCTCPSRCYLLRYWIVYINNVFANLLYCYASNMLSALVMWIFIRQITGAPLPTYSSCTPSTVPLPLSTLVDAAVCAQSDQRSMWDIVWGCIVTIFSCTWIAIHPNISGPDDSRWCVFKRELTITMCALLAPELIMAWALRQHIGAWQFMQDYNEDILKSTKMHSFGVTIT
jgi:hypothetical protein